MFRPRSAMLVAGALAVAALPASAPAATKTVTHKVKSGTTMLTLSPQSIANLQSMGITMAAASPASTANNVLKFPVKAGTKIKTKGTNKVVSGKIVHLGTLTMSKDTTIVPLTSPTVTFGPKPSLSGTFGVGSINVGTLTIRASKTKIAKKSMKITGVSVRLTAEAAGAMNGVFGVTGFKQGDLVGTATMTVKFK
jgi:hypothetical protein